MRLHLVRHGDAQPRREERPDAERALTEDGRHRTRVQAEAIGALVPGVDRIVASPYRRAVQTASILADALDVEAIDELGSLIPEADPRDAAEALLDEAGRTPRVAVVGHRPQLAGLAATLLCGDPDRFDVHLATASLLTMRVEAGEATLERLVQARELRVLGEQG